MIKEITDKIFRIRVPLPNNPLKWLNSYFIRGDDGDLLIDTGFRLPECREALSAGLRELGAEQDRLDILATHLHSDHTGMVDLFAGENRRIYMSGRDIEWFDNFLRGKTGKNRMSRYTMEGFPLWLNKKIEPKNPSSALSTPRMDPRFTPLDPGQTLEVGDIRLKMINANGHTPGAAMVWLPDQKIMFTGDHILFDITPNITAWGGVTDTLGDYLNNLRIAGSYDVKTALPAHRNTGDYHERIRELLRHHKARLAEVVRIIQSEPGLNAFEITARMTWSIRARNWEEFPDVQKWFAFGECLSHLDYLRLRGIIERDESREVRRYFPA